MQYADLGYSSITHGLMCKIISLLIDLVYHDEESFSATPFLAKSAQNSLNCTSV